VIVWNEVRFSTILAQNLARYNDIVKRDLQKNRRIKGRKKTRERIRNNLIVPEELPNILGRLRGSR